MRIDQLPADGGGASGVPAAGSLVADATSINGNANLLIEIAGFADDQYLDAVALFAALATRLRTAGSDFVKVDDDTALRFLDSVLEYGQYVAPEAR
ncbi:hypothetical protein PV682_14695 [Streptomyces niveiscabiei]|uniref:hypothetical protein n=1 Tax=Streptomyces niveiscabiei TaxID=164115 RepID=UPI0029A8DF8B|nr:hypothetical protein [Streptomyces niveiscabiei]MDX3382708.1 hypothetical protein [Streptomyces niveiscabiei]